MSEPSLPELEAERERLYAQLSEVGDFRRGSVSENYRKCGKPNMRVRAARSSGSRPRLLWTRTVRGQRTRGRQLAASEVEKVRGELAAYQEFASLAERIVDVNEAICEARPPAARETPFAPEGEKGISAALAEEKAAETGRLAAEAARSLGCGEAGLGAAEAVLRAGLLKLGGGVLGEALSADPGYRGPRVR